MENEGAETAVLETKAVFEVQITEEPEPPILVHPEDMHEFDINA